MSANMMWRGFWDGLIAPTGFAFGLMILVAALPFLFLSISFTEARIAGPAGAYLPRDVTDSDGFATHEAIQLKYGAAEISDGHALYLLGDSIVAQAFADDRLLAHALEADTGEPWRVAFLTTGAQMPLDEAALADYATRRRLGVVVLPLSVERFVGQPAQFIESYRQGRLGFRSDWADQDVRMLGEQAERRTGIYLIDNRKFVSRHLWMSVRALTGQQAPHRIDNFLLTERISPPMLRKQRENLLAGLRNSMNQDQVNFRVLADTTRRLIARGNRIIFIEDPINEAAFENAEDAALYATYLKRSFALARAMGGYYCPLERGHAVTAKSFADYFHVRDYAEQSRFRQVLAGCVVDASKAGPAA